MTQQHLSQIETGRQPASMGLRRLFHRELGISLDDLGLASGRPVVGGDVAPEVTASRMRWRDERRWLNQHRSQLSRLAVGLYPDDLRVPRSPLLAPPSWRLDRPIDLDSLELTLDESPQGVRVDGSEPESEPMRPLRTPGTRFDRYTTAVRYIEPPALFENRPSYRLMGGTPRAGRLDFAMAAYFDKLDVSEAVGHELAAACMRLGGVPQSPDALTGGLPFRDLIGDPFNPDRRAIIPAITTLTIRLRRYPAEPTFLLHRREPGKVATSGGLYGVVPAGEFQPSSVALWDRRADFDLWRNVVREYSEELLGAPEHDGTRTQPIDYDRWPLYRRLTQARVEGTVHAAVLGLGLDALSQAATFLTAVVLDDDVFSEVFGETVRYNEEGEILSPGGAAPADGIPFTEASVTRMLTTQPMTSPAAGCLSLAWQHRRQLLAL